MNEPPKMISTKDLDYISDMFEWNFTASKVANCFEEKVIDPEIKDLIKRVKEMHTGICKKLVNILGGQNG